MNTQLTLRVGLDAHASFENFFSGQNATALKTLDAVVRSAEEQQKEQQLVFLWGNTGVGKTHVLHASCRTAETLGLRARYIPCEKIGDESLDDSQLAGLDVIAFDDLQYLLPNRHNERLLLRLYEGVNESGMRLLISADKPPQELQFSLPDVKTRLSAKYVFQLRALSDEDRAEAIRFSAQRRGLHIDNDVVQYILSRLPRDNTSLFSLIDQIDTKSLQHQRLITVPFVRDIMLACKSGGLNPAATS